MSFENQPREQQPIVDAEGVPVDNQQPKLSRRRNEIAKHINQSKVFKQFKTHHVSSFDNQRKENDRHELLEKSGDEQYAFDSDDEDCFARADAQDQG